MTDTGKRHHLSGRVKHHGVPVVGATIKIYPSYRSLYGDQAIYQGSTGKEGEFDFVVDPGVYKLEVNPTRNGRFLIKTIADIEVKGNTKFSVTLATGNLVSGSVKLSTGEALKNCEVLALGIEPSSYRSTATVDDFGKFSLILPNGKFQLAVKFASTVEKPRPQFIRTFNSKPLRDDHYPVSIPFVSSKLEVVTVDNDQPLDIYLPKLVELSAIVENAFGQPVSQATVKITPNRTEEDVETKEFNLSTALTTDDDGRFRVLLQPSSYTLEIQPSSSSSHFGILEKDLVVVSDLESKFTLEPGHKVDGRVVFEREPVADCLIRLMDREGTRDIITRSDRAGLFSVSLPRGTYKMVVAAPPTNDDASSGEDKKARLAPWSRMIVVGGDTTVDVRLEPGSQLTGKVRDDKNQPRAGILLSIFMDTGDKPLISPVELDTAMSRTTTDSAGHYSILLSPGSYWVLVHKDFENLRRVTIDREPQELDITWQGWCQVHFEVTSESGEKIPRCQVKYKFYGDDNNDPREKQGKIAGHVTTSEDGTCQITLPKGVYTFDFVPPLDGSYESRQIRQLSINADLTRKIWLSAKD